VLNLRTIFRTIKIFYWIYLCKMVSMARQLIPYRRNNQQNPIFIPNSENLTPGDKDGAIDKNICEICWEREAVGRCLKCSRWACENHIANDMCSICRAFICSICRKHLAIASCILCGRIACYRCLDRRNNSLICMCCRISAKLP